MTQSCHNWCMGHLSHVIIGAWRITLGAWRRCSMQLSLRLQQNIPTLDEALCLLGDFEALSPSMVSHQHKTSRKAVTVCR